MISPGKPETVAQMFDRVAERYDLLNSVLSLGTHWLWKKKLVNRGAKGLAGASKILDCATGTGDIAELWSKKLGPSAQIIATDFSAGMLDCARKRHSGSAIRFDWADVQKLSFEDGSFDRASISFGIRNVQDPLAALKELGRVVCPGGQVLILEFGQPSYPVFSSFYRFYSEKILPQIGGIISGQKSAYRYLSDSSARFPCGERFLEIVRQAGKFKSMRAESLTGGIAWLYILNV